MITRAGMTLSSEQTSLFIQTDFDLQNEATKPVSPTSTILNQLSGSNMARVAAGAAEVKIHGRPTFQNHCITGWLGQ